MQRLCRWEASPSKLRGSLFQPLVLFFTLIFLFIPLVLSLKFLISILCLFLLNYSFMICLLLFILDFFELTNNTSLLEPFCIINCMFTSF
ncbi:unnamed protein product, partial [Brassica napus]